MKKTAQDLARLLLKPYICQTGVSLPHWQRKSSGNLEYVTRSADQSSINLM